MALAAVGWAGSAKVAAIPAFGGGAVAAGGLLRHGVDPCWGQAGRLWQCVVVGTLPDCGAVVGKGVVEYRSASPLWNGSGAGFGRSMPGDDRFRFPESGGTWSDDARRNPTVLGFVVSCPGRRAAGCRAGWVRAGQCWLPKRRSWTGFEPARV